MLPREDMELDLARTTTVSCPRVSLRAFWTILWEMVSVNQQVGAAQAVFQGPAHFGDHLGRTLIGTAEVLVLSDHTLVSA